MPIYYDTELKGFVLKDSSSEEKQAIFNIAIEAITGAFGDQVAEEIIKAAKKHHEENDKEMEEGDVRIYDAPTLN